MLQLASILVSLFVGYGLVIEDPSLITRLPDIISYLCPSSDVCSSNRSSETKDYVELGPEMESCCAGDYINSVFTVVTDIYFITKMFIKTVNHP
jgi:hypothetical protein